MNIKVTDEPSGCHEQVCARRIKHHKQVLGHTLQLVHAEVIWYRFKTIHRHTHVEKIFYLHATRHRIMAFSLQTRWNHQRRPVFGRTMSCQITSSPRKHKESCTFIDCVRPELTEIAISLCANLFCFMDNVYSAPTLQRVSSIDKLSRSVLELRFQSILWASKLKHDYQPGARWRQPLIANGYIMTRRLQSIAFVRH